MNGSDGLLWRTVRGFWRNELSYGILAERSSALRRTPAVVSDLPALRDVARPGSDPTFCEQRDAGSWSLVFFVIEITDRKLQGDLISTLQDSSPDRYF